ERRVHPVVAVLVAHPVGDAVAGVPVLGLIGVHDGHPAPPRSLPRRWIVPAESVTAPTLALSSAARSRSFPAASARSASAAPSRSTSVLATPWSSSGRPRRSRPGRSPA